MARRTNVERPPLAAMIVRLRTGKDWTQQDLAARAGVSLSFLGMVEAGSRNPSGETLEAIADALGATEGEKKTLERLRRADRLETIRRSIATGEDEPRIAPPGPNAQPAAHSGFLVDNATDDEKAALDEILKIMRRERGDE